MDVVGLARKALGGRASLGWNLLYGREPIEYPDPAFDRPSKTVYQQKIRSPTSTGLEIMHANP